MITCIKEGFRKLIKKKEFVALANVNSKDYQKANLDIVFYLTKYGKTPGVYVTLNKPFKKISNLFKEKGIDTKLIIFIDAITKTVSGEIKKTKGCLFIGSPENLSDISIAMDQAVMALPSKEKFVFFDSLNTLLIYNDMLKVAKFIHFLAGKMHIWGVKGIIITLKREKDKELINEVTQFCDVVLELGKRKK